jgi:NADPH:quinone reductase-like Zn-dependent oxidoreductase
MKAIACPQYGPPEVLRFVTIPKPVPREKEVLIRIRATTVTVADVRIRGFNVPSVFWLPARIALGITKPRHPILGVELAGDIEATGNGVTQFKVGDAVFAATLFSGGAYAEYHCMPENGPIAFKPSNCSYQEAAALPIGARTALEFLRRARTGEGKKTLIYGASGSVGTYAVQLAKYFGADTTGVCSKENLDLVKSIGADHVIDYRDKDFTRKLERYDILFIAVDKWPFSQCQHFLADDGVYVNITNPIKNLSMIRNSFQTKRRFVLGANPPDTGEDLRFLKELVEKGTLKPVMDRAYSFDEIVEAHRYVDRGHKKGNVAITVATK